MSRLLDTTVCPDCRAPLDQAGTCTGCALRLIGPLAQELRRVLGHADVLVERLRVAPGVAAGLHHPAPADLPVAPGLPGRLAPPPRAPRRVSSLSVPWVLLGLGGLCLLVAALVFVAVTWSLLGLTGRTLVLGGLTLAVAGAAVVVTRRGLVAASEVLWVVVPGLVVLDLLGARAAGLVGLDVLGGRGTSVLVGSLVAGVALGASGWARTRPGRRLVGAEVVAALGAALVVAAAAWTAPQAAAATTVAVPVLAVAAFLASRRVPLAAAGLGVLAGLSWLLVLVEGLDRATGLVGPAAWWTEGRGWPLVACAVLAAAVVHLPRRVPHGPVPVPAARVVAAAGALLALATLVVGPVDPGRPTRLLVLLAVVLAALGAVAAVPGERDRAWGRGAVPLLVAGVTGLGGWLVTRPVEGLDPVAAWVAPAVAAALVLAAAGSTRLAPVAVRAQAGRAVLTATPAVLGLGAVVAVEGVTGSVLARVGTALLVLATAAAAAWTARDAVPGRVGAGLTGATGTAYLTGVALLEASARPALLAGVALVLALVAAAAAAERQRAAAGSTAGVLALVAGLLGALGLATGLDALGWTAGATCTLLAAYAGTLAALARPLGLGGRVAPVRLALEAVGALVAVLGVLAAAEVATGSLDTVLTVVGSGICLVAVTTSDRPGLGWVGAGVLATSTLVRVLTDVPVPELHTLPAAAVLVGAGLVRLHRDRSAGSLDVLGSGVALALVPSLLLALADPASLRGLLVGLAALAALGLGVRLRLVAPFVLGAGVVGVLALRHLEPVVGGVPEWVTLGAAGVLLLGVGVTWEARRRDLARAGRYLVGLR